MGRAKIPRTICGRAANSCFKPNGVPMTQLVEQLLHADEFEAMRLVDWQGLQQQEAALKMNISRQTLANLVKSARFKVTDCLLNGKALVIAQEI
ncbi:DUF134 domain-containing protein [Celerinatantimonas yamalensis]|uniref:UPF0251 protein ABUE30_00630 n=1 Tax=Celerinatantimonas yamalensis TaxID=559956 RepID=A0ABW9G305_9GAMM